MKNQRMISYWLWTGAFIVMVVLGCSRSASNESMVVRTAPVQNHLVKTSLTLSGVLLPTQIVDISSRISGQVKSVGPLVGDPVKKGDMVVELDTALLTPQLAQAEAALKSAQAAVEEVQDRATLASINLDNVRKNYDRSNALFHQSVATQSQMDELKARLDTALKQYNSSTGPELDRARATVDTTRANILFLQTQINCAVICSPIDGMVTNRNTDPGEIVAPGTAVMTVADTAVLKMKTFVPQDLLPYLCVGQGIEVTVDIYPERMLKGVISLIGPIAVNTGSIFPVEIAISNDGTILSGLSAHAGLLLVGKKKTVAPIAAVVESSQASYVFVIQDGVAVRRAVTTGLRNDREIEILKGLVVGEMVAVTNTRVLADHMPVVVQN